VAKLRRITRSLNFVTFYVSVVCTMNLHNETTTRYAHFRPVYAPKSVWRTGSVRTHWGAYTSPDALADLQRKEEKEKERRNDRKGEEMGKKGEDERGTEGRDPNISAKIKKVARRGRVCLQPVIRGNTGSSEAVDTPRGGV